MGYTAPLASRPSSCWEPCLGLGLWTLGFGLWSLGFGFALGFFVFCSLGFGLWALGIGSGLSALGGSNLLLRTKTSAAEPVKLDFDPSSNNKKLANDTAAKSAKAG